MTDYVPFVGSCTRDALAVAAAGSCAADGSSLTGKLCCGGVPGIPIAEALHKRGMRKEHGRAPPWQLIDNDTARAVLNGDQLARHRGLCAGVGFEYPCFPTVLYGAGEPDPAAAPPQPCGAHELKAAAHAEVGEVRGNIVGCATPAARLYNRSIGSVLQHGVPVSASAMQRLTPGGTFAHSNDSARYVRPARIEPAVSWPRAPNLPIRRLTLRAPLQVELVRRIADGVAGAFSSARGSSPLQRYRKQSGLMYYTTGPGYQHVFALRSFGWLGKQWRELLRAADPPEVSHWP